MLFYLLTRNSDISVDTAKLKKFNISQPDDYKKLNLSNDALLKFELLQQFYLNLLESDIIDEEFRGLNIEVNIFDDLDFVGSPIAVGPVNFYSSAYQLLIFHPVLEQKEFTSENLITAFAHELGHVFNHDFSLFNFFVERILSSYSFLILPTMIASYLSRHREYKADEFVMILNQGKCHHFIETLYKLERLLGEDLGQKGLSQSSVFDAFSTHPSIEKRERHLRHKGCLFYSYSETQSQCDWLEPSSYAYAL